ncbi:MAG: lysylphosphatidylglycerol synthase transmembrane domain-containing protein [Bacteroidia bacterium]|nr:lysylphosphatidylglycerol synthase transmembrane domain-containing protein [Bacteroidia bacterium]
MTNDAHYNLVSKLKPGRIILPVVIGLAVVVWFIVKDLNIDVMREITFTWRSIVWLLVAFLFIILRTFGYMARIRILTDNDLTWGQSFRVIMLWEFTSAITPSTVGGTGFAVVFLHKEGISVGRSTSVVLATSFLDELYFVVMLPILLLLVGGKAIFITSLQGTGIALLNNLVLVAIIGYIIILAWVLLVGYGLFFNPTAIKNLIINIFRLPLIRKWKASAIKAGNDIVESSIDLRMKSFSFWTKAVLSTFLSWTTRYWVVNAILVAFFVINDHLLIFTRQLVLWIMMIVSPTPGGSGFAEIILGRYISDLIPADPVHVGGVALAMALIWRIITYYPFLLAGVLIIPGWIERKFVKPLTKKK